MPASCCRTCDNRNHVVSASQSTSSLVDVCLVALTFKEDVSPRTRSYAALNTLLNDIIDAADSSSHPSAFTSWSPCLSDSRTAVVITTASETCSDPSNSIYNDVFDFLACPPGMHHVYPESTDFGHRCSDWQAFRVGTQAFFVVLASPEHGTSCIQPTWRPDKGLLGLG
jgi:hypothetical protein